MLDPGPEVPLNRVPPSDGDDGVVVGRTNDTYGARVRKTAKNYENYRHWDGGGLQFEGETNTEDDAGVCSPPLWKTSPDHHHQNNYRYLSMASKAQAIARGQRELMEMIQNMPESSYELSLKDLVEQQPRMDIRHETVAEERNSSTEVLYRKEKDKRKKNDTKVHMMRSGSMDKGGFLLKILFPISLGSKNKKKTNLAANTCSKVSPSSKVSPKPPASDGSGKGIDKEWWKKRFSASGDSESGGTSSNGGSTGSSGSRSNSSSGSNRHGCGSSTGCWLFFRSKKSKMAK